MKNGSPKTMTSPIIFIFAVETQFILDSCFWKSTKHCSTVDYSFTASTVSLYISPPAGVAGRSNPFSCEPLITSND